MEDKKVSVAKIMQYENDELNDEETIELFQELINTGLAWQLQGHYGRFAVELLEEGFCKSPNEEN
jgi:hypothetical protein